MKKYLLSDLALANYDSGKEVIVAADASENGNGAILLHELRDGSTKPIVHASITLLVAAKNYSQIEKEGLAIIFAVKKFHRYIYMVDRLFYKQIINLFCQFLHRRLIPRIVF